MKVEKNLRWRESFLEKNSISVSRTTQLRLVLDFLLHNAYGHAAQAFVEEVPASALKIYLDSDISPECVFSGDNDKIEVDLLKDDKLKIRMEIRETIMRGDVGAAMQLVTQVDPELLKTDNILHFHLKKQALIELIRDAHVGKAIVFAQEQVSPYIEGSEELQKELEEVMSLLVFGKDLDSPVRHLFSSDHRREIAFELNSALLKRENKKETSDIVRLLKLMVMTQQELNRKIDVDLPRITLGANPTQIQIPPEHN
mmetsp:Transcript_672/g.808  ORF Transcript_672/g.808 Transcript_672/m.808 type:complete len:256 (+) Transcript_672:21-788(+)